MSSCESTYNRQTDHSGKCFLETPEFSPFLSDFRAVLVPRGLGMQPRLAGSHQLKRGESPVTVAPKNPRAGPPLCLTLFLPA